jgi:hypothetical protein
LECVEDREAGVDFVYCCFLDVNEDYGERYPQVCGPVGCKESELQNVEEYPEMRVCIVMNYQKQAVKRLFY